MCGFLYGDTDWPGPEGSPCNILFLILGTSHMMKSYYILHLCLFIYRLHFSKKFKQNKAHCCLLFNNLHCLSVTYQSKVPLSHAHTAHAFLLASLLKQVTLIEIAFHPPHAWPDKANLLNREENMQQST